MAAATVLSQQPNPGTSIPLARAKWCEDCQTVVDTAIYCPHCSTANLVPLQRWLNRPGADALRAALTDALAIVGEELDVIIECHTLQDDDGNPDESTLAPEAAEDVKRFRDVIAKGEAALATPKPAVLAMPTPELAKPHILLVCFPTDELNIGFHGHARAEDGTVLTHPVYAASRDEVRRQLEAHHELYTRKYDDFELDWLPHPEDSALYRAALDKAAGEAVQA